jgi:hypothetical protein
MVPTLLLADRRIFISAFQEKKQTKEYTKQHEIPVFRGSGTVRR